MVAPPAVNRPPLASEVRFLGLPLNPRRLDREARYQPAKLEDVGSIPTGGSFKTWLWCNGSIGGCVPPGLGSVPSSHLQAGVA